MNTYIFDRLKKALRLGAIAFLLPLSSSLFTACEDVPMPFNNPELPPEPDIVVIEPSGDGTKENPYNVAGVLAYINTLGADVESTRDIYVTGVVTAVTESFSVQYGNASFVISDTDEGANKFTFYRGLYLGNTKYNNENDTNVKEDDVVVICGKIVNYRGSTPETVQNKAYLVSLNGKTVEPAPEPTEADAKGSGTQADPYNVAGALKYITSLGADVNSPNDIFIKGKVKEVKEQFGTQYGNSTFTMVDEGFDAIFTAYRILYLGNAKYTEGDVLKEGDEVIVCGKVVNYRGNTPETVQGSAYLYSLNGKTGSGGGGGETPVGDAKGSGTQADPYNAAGANAYIASLAADTESDKEIYVKGKIIEITDKNQFNTNYGNCTFYISDDGQDGDNKFYVFRTYYLGNVKYSDDSWTLPKAGDAQRPLPTRAIYTLSTARQKPAVEAAATQQKPALQQRSHSHRQRLMRSLLLSQLIRIQRQTTTSKARSLRLQTRTSSLPSTATALSTSLMMVPTRLISSMYSAPTILAT